MAEKSNWHRSMLGRAKAAFNQARTSPPPPAKPVEKAAGRESEMVKKSKPAMEGPKPPEVARAQLARQEHERAAAAEDKAVKAAHTQAETRKIQRPVIQSEHLKEGARLHEQFRKAAQKDRDKGR
jgi:hypothetical protein